MKTTIDIADSILKESKALAARRSTTLRALIEGELRRVIEEDQRAGTFQLGELPARGGGCVEGMDPSDWSALRDEIYQGRGA